MTESDITPTELNDELKGGATYQLVDVREPHEWEMAHLDNAKHIPLGSLTTRVSELDPAIPTVVYCRSGMRSARAAQMLRQHGFNRVMNLTGGIIRWAKEVDPRITRV